MTDGPVRAGLEPLPWAAEAGYSLWRSPSRSIAVEDLLSEIDRLDEEINGPDRDAIAASSASDALAQLVDRLGLRP